MFDRKLNMDSIFHEKVSLNVKHKSFYLPYLNEAKYLMNVVCLSVV